MTVKTDHPNKQDIQFLLCLALVVLALFTGFFAGGHLEKNNTIRVLHNQIEKLEATR